MKYISVVSKTPSKTTESGEKGNEEASKSLNTDENPDGEEVPDDLSEISDEADDILGHEVRN